MATMILITILVASFPGCNKNRPELPAESSGVEIPVARQDVSIRVVDVSNKTRDLYDVDAIGLLWTGLDEGLRDRGLLWQGDRPTPVLRLYAEIITYEKGNFLLRPFFSTWGKAHLVARCELKEGDRVIATAEAKHTVSMGTEWLKKEAYKKVFKIVANDLINQIVRKL
ncbi:MAG: hypothetical protein AB9873_14595 [Syntrophobacteraceae bacterium]